MRGARRELERRAAVAVEAGQNELRMDERASKNGDCAPSESTARARTQITTYAAYEPHSRIVEAYLLI